MSQFAVACLILNRAIGSGIFIQPFNVLFQIESTGIALLIWVVAGLVVLVLMLCWVEMALSVPRYLVRGVMRPIISSGGDGLYLQHLYSRPRFLITCIFGITQLVFGNLGAEAIQFGISMQTLIDPGCAEGQPCYSRYKVVGWGLGAVCVCAISAAMLRLRGGRYLPDVNVLFALVKVIFLVTTAITGIAYGTMHGNQCQRISWQAGSDKGNSAGDISLAVLLATYAYAGFEQPFYVLADIKHPRRIAKSATTAVLILVVLFPLVNLGYMCAAPDLQNPTERNVVIAIYRVLGPEDSMTAERVISAVLAVFILGSILAQTFTSAPVIFDIVKGGILSFPLSSRLAPPLFRTLKTLRVPLPIPWSRPTILTIGATVLFSAFSILGISLVGFSVSRPSASYVYLSLLRTLGITGILGFLLAAGLVYQKIRKPYLHRFSILIRWHRLKWLSPKMTKNLKPFLDPLPVVCATVALGFLVIAVFVGPQKTLEGAALPYWAIPLLAWAVPLSGVAWWFGLLCTELYKHKVLTVKKTLFVVARDDGTAVVADELVEPSWIPRQDHNSFVAEMTDHIA
ncbi:amino acid transporter [Echria macrotheca]|uniref:Amino acid transporter n=1 Tax=Echria macrotheca TaxID=438768 RepID=A0AAJ0BNJ9_9PEZI|nr:amino acid transporter [Echria macrotheca]